MANYGLMAALISVFSFSLGDSIGKRVSVSYGNYRSAIFIIGIGIIPLLIALLLARPSSIGLQILALSFTASVFFALGYIFVYKSLETEQASNTWVLVNIPAAFLVIFGTLSLHETVSPAQVFSIIMVFIGATLVTITTELKINRRLMPALLGNTFWAIFLVIIAYAISKYADDSALFFFMARLLAFVEVGLYYYLFVKPREVTLKGKVVKKKPYRGISAVCTGLLDGIAQAVFVPVILLRFVALGGAILALEPAIVLPFSYIFYKERLTSLQFAGMVMSIAGAVTLSLIA